MFDRARRISFEDVCLGALLLSSAVALAQSMGGRSYWVVIPCVPALLMRLERLSVTTSRQLNRAGQALILVTVLFGLAWTLYPVMPDNLVRRAPTVLGGGLVCFASLFYMGPAVWSRYRTFLPTVLALLALAAYNPDAKIDVAMGAAIAAVFSYFASGRAPRLVVYGLVAVALGIGIARFLPWAQPKVEAASVGLLADAGAKTGLSLSDTARLGEVEELATSETVALRVWSGRPQKLRARVLTRFDGAAWHARGGAQSRDLEPTVDPGGSLGTWLAGLPGRTFVVPGRSAHEVNGAEHSKVVAEISSPVLLAPAGALLVRTPVSPTRIDSAGILTTTAQTSIYGIVNAPGHAAAEPIDDLLAVPADTDPRVRGLAQRLAAEAPPAERARRTLEHLARECRYSLKVGRFQSQQPVAEFLFDKKRGYCEYFASAAALLLRLQGVPTRFVTGYNVTSANYVAGYYVVRESDAHAWIDAYFEDAGWVELDPTPADQYADVHAGQRPGPFLLAWEGLRSLGIELVALLRSGDVRVIARRASIPSALLAVVAAAVVLRRRRARPVVARREPPRVPPELTALLSQLDEDWSRAGCPRAPVRAPLEHLDGLPEGRLTPAFHDASRAAVDFYYRVRYAGAPLVAAELMALREGLLASRRSPRG